MAKAIAARKAAPETNVDCGERVRVRVLPQGADRIFTGQADATAAEAATRFPTYPRGAVLVVAREIAEALEARGLVEIQG